MCLVCHEPYVAWYSAVASWVFMISSSVAIWWAARHALLLLLDGIVSLPFVTSLWVQLKVSSENILLQNNVVWNIWSKFTHSHARTHFFPPWIGSKKQTEPFKWLKRHARNCWGQGAFSSFGSREFTVYVQHTLLCCRNKFGTTMCNRCPSCPSERIRYSCTMCVWPGLSRREGKCAGFVFFSQTEVLVCARVSVRVSFKKKLGGRGLYLQSTLYSGWSCRHQIQLPNTTELELWTEYQPNCDWGTEAYLAQEVSTWCPCMCADCFGHNTSQGFLFFLEFGALDVVETKLCFDLPPTTVKFLLSPEKMLNLASHTGNRMEPGSPWVRICACGGPKTNVLSPGVRAWELVLLKTLVFWRFGSFVFCFPILFGFWFCCLFLCIISVCRLIHDFVQRAVWGV